MKAKVTLCIIALLCAVSTFAKDIKTVVLTPQPKMNCGSCENKIKNGLKSAKGIKSIETDLESQTISITYDADKTSVDAISKAFANINYTVTEAGAQSAAPAKKGSCCGGGKAEEAAPAKKGSCCGGGKAEEAAPAKKGGCSGCGSKKAAEGSLTANFKAPSIKCGGCANKVTNALKAVDGVSDVEVSVADKTVKVVYRDAATASKIDDAFKSLGYDDVVKL